MCGQARRLISDEGEKDADGDESSFLFENFRSGSVAVCTRVLVDRLEQIFLEQLKSCV